MESTSGCSPDPQPERSTLVFPFSLLIPSRGRTSSTLGLQPFEKSTITEKLFIHWNFLNVTLQLCVKLFSTGVSSNGSQVLWTAWIVNALFESDLGRPVLQAIFLSSNDHPMGFSFESFRILHDHLPMNWSVRRHAMWENAFAVQSSFSRSATTRKYVSVPLSVLC